MSEWKSPRQIEEQIQGYQRKRFEYWWGEQDRGAIERPLALAALREEIGYTDLRSMTPEMELDDTQEMKLF